MSVAKISAVPVSCHMIRTHTLTPNTNRRYEHQDIQPQTMAYITIQTSAIPNNELR